MIHITNIIALLMMLFYVHQHKAQLLSTYSSDVDLSVWYTCSTYESQESSIVAMIRTFQA